MAAPNQSLLEASAIRARINSTLDHVSACKARAQKTPAVHYHLPHPPLLIDL
jgi:hypothetical protein